MRRLVLWCVCTILLALPRIAAADCVSLTSFGTAYTQNFDTLASSGTSSALPAGWAFVETGTNANTTYGTGTGSSTTGDTYSFGATSSSERAFGGLLSGSLTPTIGACFTNDTGGTITSLDIAYTGEQWRAGVSNRNAADRLDFQYGVGATSLTTGTWTDLNALDFNSPNILAAAGALDGNAPANRASLAGSLTLSISPGATVWIRWLDFNISSSDDGLAVDNFALTAQGTGSGTPSLTIADVTPFNEGDSATKTVTFTVSVAPAPASDITFDIATANGTATAGTDYVARTVTGATIPAGQSSYTFDVVVNGDTDVESDETFSVSVTNVSGATLVRGQAFTTILNDDVTPPPAAPNVVISQIYGGGGNSNGTYKYDYVELYNPTPVPVNLAGWTLQYASATGTGPWAKSLPLVGSIQPGTYYLISLATTGGIATENPPANLYADMLAQFNLGSTAGKVALVDNNAALTDCPAGNSHVVDLVGYGATANCKESAVAPAPSNTAAIFRRANGAQDTNNNANDFFSGTPAPRRTADLVDLPPVLIAADPDINGLDAPRDASIEVSFSEPVDLRTGWFSIQCATTGLHTDGTVANIFNSSKTYLITPNTSFKNGEQCTITLTSGAVSDRDGTSFDTLSSSPTWTFTTSSGNPPPYPPDVHLTMGNPSGANISDPDNYLLEKPEYAVSYNRSRGTPNWSSWHLSSEWFNGLSREDTFRPDPEIPPDWYRVLYTDYTGSGFDRGHMTPNADRAREVPIVQATFLMTNMIPQANDNNAGPWARLETYLRTLTPANEVYIVSGPWGVGGIGRFGYLEKLSNNQVTVPAKTWKVALVLPKADGDDLRSVTAASRTIAVIMPNTQGIGSDPWEKYLVRVDDVEQLTGYNFFSNVPEAVQNSIESGINGVGNKPGAGSSSASTREDTNGAVTLDAVSPSGAALTYTIVTAPAHGTLSGSGATQTYTPAPDYYGTDGFTFNASDGTGTSNTAAVSITVREVNDAPVTLDDSKSTDEDTPLSFAAADLTANDNAGPNESSQTLTVSSVAATAQTHGTVVLNGSVITYTPDANFNGAAGFTYRLCDNGTTEGASDPLCTDGTVNLTVNAVNDAPVLSAVAPITIEAGGTASFTATATDVDVPAQPLTFGLSGAPAGASINPSTGAFSWTPSETQAGAPYSFTLTVTDGVTTTSGTVNVTVTDTTAPSISPFQLSVMTLWPVSHKMVDVTVGYSVSDFGDTAPACSLSVSSNEPVNGIADGTSSVDWQVVDAHHVQLRAERAGTGDGRIYTITADCHDRFGNLSHQSGFVTVAKSQGN